MITTEDLLECLAGLTENKQFQLVPSDYNLLLSLARQVFKGIGLTDRQYELAKAKLVNYKEQFSELGYDVDAGLEHLRIPLREIDRSRWIRIIEDDNSFKIAVRFTFQKKLISAIESIQVKGDYDKINKIHYFNYTERNLWEIVKAFDGKNFELDDTAQVIIDKLKNLKEKEHIPGVYEGQLLNLPERGINYITNEIGLPTLDNLLIYKDRRFRYGLNHFDEDKVRKSQHQYSRLAAGIANRSHLKISVDTVEHSVSDLFLALSELKRFPILVCLPEEKCYDALVTIQKNINSMISNDSISVMFRLDNTGEGIEFNRYVKDQRLNNKLAKTTKIVYTTDNKIPKTVYGADWEPKTILIFNSENFVNSRKIAQNFTDKDLIIFYGTSVITKQGFHNQLESV